MKKYNYLFILMLSLFMILPIKTMAATTYRNVGKDIGAYPNVNGAMYSYFESDQYFGFTTRGNYYVKWLQNTANHNEIFIVYCVGLNQDYNYVETYTNEGAYDAGVGYIIKNGFTGTGEPTNYHYSTTPCGSNIGNSACSYTDNIESNAPKKNTKWWANYWLTQLSIWMYLYDGTSTGGIKDQLHDIANVLKGNNLSANYQIIKNLVDGAKEAKQAYSAKPTLSVANNTLELDGDYFYSQIISAANVGETYSISVDNSNYEVVDANKTKKTTFNAGDKFYVRVAKSKVTSADNVTVTISTTKKTYATVYRASGAQSVARYNESAGSTSTNTLKLTVNPACDLKVTVTDSVTKEKVCGGSFDVLDENGNRAKNIQGEEIGTIELSDTKCEVTLSLPDGKYRVVQKTAKDSYVKDDIQYEINTETQCPLTVELKNEKLYQIRVLKVSDSEDNPLAGASLKLEDSNGNVIKEFVSTTEPQIIDKLHLGTYYLSETKAPKGYSLSTEKITIEVNSENNDKQFIFKNDEVIVPITDFDAKTILIGLLLGAIGISLIVYANKKRVHSS